MDNARFIKLVTILIWTLILTIYITKTLIINPIVKSYKYYKAQRDIALLAEGFVREISKNPEKYYLLDTTKVTDMRQMFFNSDQIIDISHYGIKERCER